MAEPTKPAARRRTATTKRAATPKRPATRKATAARRKAAAQSPLEFLQSVYREPIPDDVDAATRAKIVANKMAAAKLAHEIERGGNGPRDGELAALLHELGEAGDDIG